MRQPPPLVAGLLMVEEGDQVAHVDRQLTGLAEAKKLRLVTRLKQARIARRPHAPSRSYDLLNARELPRETLPACSPAI